MGNIENAVQALGVDVSLLPDRLETTMLAAVCENLGIDTSTIPDNLKTSFLKAIAKCDVASGGGGTDERFKQLVEGTITEVNDSEITTVRKSAFKGVDIIKASFPNVTNLGNECFDNCQKLEEVYFPSLTNVSAQKCFNYCMNLIKVNVQSMISVGNNCFSNCLALPSLDFPSLEQIKATFAFSYGYSLKAFIMRNSEKMVTLSAANNFNYCYHFHGTADAKYNPEGLKDGYFYVPRKWLSDEDETQDYRRATNWATFSTQFRALEDYTVDGTTTGELDWEKVNA